MTQNSPGLGGHLPDALLPLSSLLSSHGRTRAGNPLLLGFALLLVFLTSCAFNPKPPPPPDPCPVSPYPWCHETIPPMTCGDCIHQPLGEECPVLAPECPVKPPPPPPPPPQGRCPQGKPQARGPIPHGRGVWDATPAVCKPDWTPDCYTGRYCHPVACEGPDSADDREFCEEQLMGGTAPVWELDVSEGSLCLVPSEWFAILGGKKGGFCRRGSGSGKARLRWCFPNGKACSKWIEVSR